MTGPAPCLEVNSAGIGNVQASSILGKVFGLHNDKICIKIKQNIKLLHYNSNICKTYKT